MLPSRRRGAAKLFDPDLFPDVVTQIRDWIETTEGDDFWIGRSGGSGVCKFLPLSASSDQLLLGNILAIIAATVLGSCCPSVPSSV